MAITSALAFVLLATVGAGDFDGPSLPYSVVPLPVGASFDTRDSIYHVFRTADEFLANWKRDDNCDDTCARSVITQIDFSRNMLAVIAPRDRGQQTYDVVVTGVTAAADSVVIYFQELRYGPPQGELLCGITLVMPTPTALIVIPKSNLPVHFLRARADVICEEPVEVQ